MIWYVGVKAHSDETIAQLLDYGTVLDCFVSIPMTTGKPVDVVKLSTCAGQKKNIEKLSNVLYVSKTQ